jgi:hypothetical protein
VSTSRWTAVVVGLLFIVGTVAGVMSVLVTSSIVGDPNYLSAIVANEAGLKLGALLVLTMGLALALIPVVIYPIARRYNERLALGYVVFRGALEPIAYIGMVVAWLALIPLSQAYVQAGVQDPSQFQTVGAMLMGTHDAINDLLVILFSLGALMFYSMLYQSRLIPRWLSVWGLLAILIHLATAFLIMLGGMGADSTPILLMNFPIFLQEMVMAVWLIIKGFAPSAVTPGQSE